MFPSNPRHRLYLGVALLLAAVVGIYGLNLVSRKHVGEAPVAAPSASPFAVNARGQIAQFQFHDAPKDMTLPALKDAAGATVPPERWQGKVTLVNLWATWCPPCRAEMPELGKLQAALGGADFEVVTVNLDTAARQDKAREFLSAAGAGHLTFYRDDDGAMRDALSVPGLPATLLFDRQGRELGRLLGPAQWASADAQSMIKAVMDSK